MISHSGVVWGGFDGRTIAVGVLAVILAVALGGVAGSRAGAGAGALAALAGLIPPAALAVAMEQRARNAARLKRRKDVLRKYAPPQPEGSGDGENEPG